MIGRCALIIEHTRKADRSALKRLHQEQLIMPHQGMGTRKQAITHTQTLVNTHAHSHTHTHTHTHAHTNIY